MTASHPSVFLNSFKVKKLSEQDKTVQVYTYELDTLPEAGKEQATLYSKIIWKLNLVATPLGTTIVSRDTIAPARLQGEGWTLHHSETKQLNPSLAAERHILEKLERRWLGNQLWQYSKSRKVERRATGLIWWDTQKTILQDSGWEVHQGVEIGVSINYTGVLYLEIDSHHRLYSPWTLQQWLDHYPDIPIQYVRNTYDDRTWRLKHISNENAQELIIPGLGKSLADYHRHLEQSKAATELEIREAQVVYVENSKNKSNEISHLSTRLRPSVTMEILGDLANRGEKEAGRVFTQLRKPIKERLEKSAQVATGLIKQVYEQKISKAEPQQTSGIIVRSNSPILLTKTTKVFKASASLQKGCLKVGETRFGFLNLVDSTKEAEAVKRKLEETAQKSGTELYIEEPKVKADIPDSLIRRRQFWQDWADQGTRTILVVCNWLGDGEKYRLRREALEANIALQFMVATPSINQYKVLNVVLGLLVKAKWQTVGLEPLQHPKAAEIVIGFDAGTNRSLYYGTSAFAILANGQSLGWEVPEAQRGETISGKAVLRTVISLVDRFRQLEDRLPRRMLLLRDGLIQQNEFDEAVYTLEQDDIAVDLLEVRKSGAGRMAIYEQSQYKDAKPGTAVIASDGNSFRIVTSEAKAGGSARPLQVVRDRGDAPIEVLVQQIYRLSQLHPASGSFSSRLPMVLHYADKMAKEVQNLGQVGVLQNVDREKIFFA